MNATTLKAVLLSATFFFSAANAGSGSEFLSDAAKGDNAEIMMGKLAQTKSTNKGVQQFGTTLVTDHTKAKKEVAMLATSMSFNMPSDVAPEAQHAYDKLAQMSGAQFDKEFIGHMVMDHKKDIAAFTKQADAHDGKVSELASKQLPVLKKHLAMAEALQTGKKGSMDSMQGVQPPQRLP